MNEQELDEFRSKIAELAQSGTEAEVRAYIDDQFPRLPESMQNEILASLFTTALEEQVQDDEVLDAVQERGLKAIDELEQLQTEVEKEPEDTA